MAPPNPVVVFFAVGSVIFIIGGLIAFYRSSVTVDLAFVLILLAVTVGVWGVVGMATVAWEAEKVDYTATQSSDCPEPSDRGYGPTSENPAMEFSELSPEAQNVFLSTIQTRREYTTMTLPDEFNPMADTVKKNYIRYESDCYELIAEPIGSLGTGLTQFFYLIAGFIGMSVLAFASYVFKS
jgi:hypothetical protein